MSFKTQVVQTSITTLLTVLGEKDTFKRIVAEMDRVNYTMPSATGSEKRAIVLADVKIIFNDIVRPVAESVLRLCIELGMVWLRTQVK